MENNKINTIVSLYENTSQKKVESSFQDSRDIHPQIIASGLWCLEDEDENFRRGGSLPILRKNLMTTSYMDIIIIPDITC